jgi:propionyl-CoA carboxylase alpha chain
MNTRLQVEHPVTELVTGIDLVEQMLRVAAGEKLSIAQKDVRLHGWAIESRLYAEDPYRNFLPSIGRLSRYRPPEPIASPTAVVRNDTGVFEGGEISMFYDPMIAKLCAWGPERPDAIETMRAALDAFELEGIGHNLPFLSAVMDHPRFVSGEITTAFIAEEYPDGFHGATLAAGILDDLAAIAIVAKYLRQKRAAGISGTLSNHERAVSAEWVARIDESVWRGRISPSDGGFAIDMDNGRRRRVTITDAAAFQPLLRVQVDGVIRVVKVAAGPSGYRMRYRGADLAVTVLTPRHDALARLMPVKAPPDTSKFLLCPMPGLVVRIDVAEGDEVQDGQSLCMVEAMKMENVLRAERSARVARVLAKPGDSLGVDDVIMEFE